MKAIWLIFSGDMRNLLRNAVAAVVVMGLVLVPPLYAWFTTLGFWDPYSNTGNIKVAVASNDEGYQSDLIPTRINAGEQVVSALRANDRFDWQFVTEQQATDGVDSGEYYAAMIIPKSFTADLMTVFSDHITDSAIIYYSNEKENAIAQRVTSTGASTLQETIDQTFTETVADVALSATSDLTNFMSGEGVLDYARTLESRLGSTVDETVAAADQAASYADLMASTASLVRASAEVLGQAGNAPDAVVPLIDQARGGLADATNALEEAESAGDSAMSSANASCDSLQQATNTAFATMADDPAVAADMLTAAAGDVQGLEQTYRALRDQLSAADPNSAALPAVDQAISDLQLLDQRLRQASGALASSSGSVDEARQKVQDSLNQARDSLASSQEVYQSTLKGELDSLADNLQAVGADTESLAASLKETASSLGNSADSLSQNLTDAETALRRTADTLTTTADELSHARDDLAAALDSGDVQEVRRIIGDNPSSVARFLSAPTQIVTHPVYPMDNNGSAMSPFYTSLCLWIGAIFMVALMSVQVSAQRQRQVREVVGRPLRQSELYLGRYGVFCVLGLLQALIVALGNVFFLGVECQHFWLYLAACCLASVVFTAIVYTLTVSFGNIGKALAIIGLVLQLGGAGGLMPVQMSAPFFQAVYPWLPFAHSMEAIQGAMAGIYGNHYLVSMGLLAAFLVPVLVLGLVLRRPIIRLNDWVLAKLDETKVV
ncbi:YhgE/Pip domain-containing protein [Adlercreutzia aquisgranensis]|uniref:YhgE/Pip domain-containing protein n=1 Tax=Muribaculaceae bacterium Z82 TaxID=2304548 RepID=A0A7C9NZF0_9BACT|nr:YhgE/Pip domain-containing protein [Adlercreutzia aquisgranensis]